MEAPESVRNHPWIQEFDHATLTTPEAWVVGGVILRNLVPGGREPRDLDVQFEGPATAAAELEKTLRAIGIPANVRSLQSPGVRDMMSWAAGW